MKEELSGAWDLPLYYRNDTSHVVKTFPGEPFPEAEYHSWIGANIEELNYGYSEVIRKIDLDCARVNPSGIWDIYYDEKLVLNIRDKSFKDILEDLGIHYLRNSFFFSIRDEKCLLQVIPYEAQRERHNYTFIGN